jgi:hypothetical protein
MGITNADRKSKFSESCIRNLYMSGKEKVSNVTTFFVLVLRFCFVVDIVFMHHYIFEF